MYIYHRTITCTYNHSAHMYECPPCPVHVCVHYEPGHMSVVCPVCLRCRFLIAVLILRPPPPSVFMDTNRVQLDFHVMQPRGGGGGGVILRPPRERHVTEGRREKLSRMMEKSVAEIEIKENDIEIFLSKEEELHSSFDKSSCVWCLM